MAITALIVDDELNNRENLHALLEQYCKEVEVIGLSSDGVKTVVDAIHERKVELGENVLDILATADHLQELHN